MRRLSVSRATSGAVVCHRANDTDDTDDITTSSGRQKRSEDPVNYVDNLSEEVKKGMREKAAQGHWPTVAPIGYVNNRTTHRIDVDPVRGPLVARIFELYATGQYSLQPLMRKAYEIGLRHPRADRRMTKSEIPRMLTRLGYTRALEWFGQTYRGSHEPLITRNTFDQVRAVLHRKPRARYPTQRHAFMGLLKCGRCGCSMTAEKKK